jgi:uncharacterized protein (TIGR03435 family)
MKHYAFFGLKSHRKISMLAAGLFTLAVSARGQTNPIVLLDAHDKAPAYDVVSVRSNNSNNGSMMIGSPADGFTARNVTLWDLIYNAYDVKPSTPIPGLPGWATTAHFDVEAKMDDGSYAALQRLPPEQRNEHKQLMLQSLLAHRFQLQIRHEITERPVYDLDVAKGGFKLKEAPADEKRRGISWGNGQLNMRPGSIARLAFTLSDLLDRNVVDKTGLAGNYDVSLTWTPDERRGTDDSSPSIFTALEEQLGLKLVPSKSAVDIIVVDHVERPSEN